jgi:hypothetical protein
MEPRAYTPLVESFPKTTKNKHDLKHPGSVDLITIKQNKLPSFIDRFPYFADTTERGDRG